MMPTISGFTLDLGSEAIRFGWAIDGTAIILLVALLVPWIVLGVAAIVDVLDRRPVETALPEATTIETTVAETPALAGAVLRRAA